ncbi:MAG: hypothetical protein PUF51_05680 [Bifidobacteriaceae bacterium]|nr:hypothetical protein [Bifidobacteriaceae bacterium]
MYSIVADFGQNAGRNAKLGDSVTRELGVMAAIPSFYGLDDGLNAKLRVMMHTMTRAFDCGMGVDWVCCPTGSLVTLCC